MRREADKFLSNREDYMLLETYKRNGEAKRTPVWYVVEESGTIFFHTNAETWKAKRLRWNPAVRIAPCSRFGRIKGADWLRGKADLVRGEENTKRIIKLVNSKYGIMGRIVGAIEKRNRAVFSIKLDSD